jgi:hypothetical protein
VERLHDYLERSFLPGRQFSCPADFNSQLAEFLVRANSRQHRVLGCRPGDRVDADRHAMLGLPPVPPVTGWRHSMRLPRDHYLRFDSNDYSVHPAVIGRRIQARADLDRLQVWCEGRLVADHQRVWARTRQCQNSTISSPAGCCAGTGSRCCIPVNDISFGNGSPCASDNSATVRRVGDHGRNSRASCGAHRRRHPRQSRTQATRIRCRSD